MRRLTKFAVIPLAVALALPVAELNKEMTGVIRHYLYIGMIFLLGWASIAAINATSNLVVRRQRSIILKTTQARKFVTQLDILRRCLVIAVAIATSGGILITFPMVRTVTSGAKLTRSAFQSRPTLVTRWHGGRNAMLTGEDVMDIRVLWRQGLSIHEIVRRTGRSRNTVRR